MAKRADRAERVMPLGGVERPDGEELATTRPLRIERRAEARTEGDVTRLWVMCDEGAMGGQVKVCDTSARGLGIAVDRGASQLVAALFAARASGATVDLYQSLHDGHRQARIVWHFDGPCREIRFGLELSSKLGGTAP